jgi:CheY-like chemotaxis protein
MLLLPASRGELAPSGEPRIAPPRPSPPRAFRVLVADDELNVRRSLGLLLRTGGHEVIECPGGRHAIEIWAAEPSGIDVAIVDLMMPDMPGREVVARLRGGPRTIPVIVSSGYSGGADLDALRDDSGVYFLHKPYTAEDLERTLVAAVVGARAT